MPRKRTKVKKSDINHMLRFFGFSKAPIRSIVAVLFLGISLGVAYEEMVGIGTWHSFHARFYLSLIKFAIAKVYYKFQIYRHIIAQFTRDLKHIVVYLLGVKMIKKEVVNISKRTFVVLKKV